MRRNFFFCLLVGLSLAFVLAFSAAPMEASAKKTKKQPVEDDGTSSQQSGVKQGQEETAKRAGTSTEISPGRINARSAILVEVSTGAVLYEQDADETIEPASFTKIASLYLIFEALKQGRIHMNDEVLISATAWRTGGSKMFVGVGSHISLDDLIKGIAVVSGNDACVAAAEHLSGSVDTFVDAMNQKAKELGMTRTRFLTPNGLPADGQVTTARDMATLDMSYLRNISGSAGLPFHEGIHLQQHRAIQSKSTPVQRPDDRRPQNRIYRGIRIPPFRHLKARRDEAHRCGYGRPEPSRPERSPQAVELRIQKFHTGPAVPGRPGGRKSKGLERTKGRGSDLSCQDRFFSHPAKSEESSQVGDTPAFRCNRPDQGRPASGRDGLPLVSDQPKRTVALVARDDIPLGGWFKGAGKRLCSSALLTGKCSVQFLAA